MKNTSIALDKLDEWFKLAKPGDMAFHFDVHESLYYIYFYTEAATKPYWNKFLDVETAQEYIDAHFNKKEGPKMNKKCENCKYFKSGGAYTWCAHEDQAGTLIPKFTCCDKHEYKENKHTPFDGMKFYLKDKDTGELSINYICEDCGKEMHEAPDRWQLVLPLNDRYTRVPGYHFYCAECYKKKDTK